MKLTIKYLLVLVAAYSFNAHSQRTVNIAHPNGIIQGFDLIDSGDEEIFNLRAQNPWFTQMVYEDLGLIGWDQGWVDNNENVESLLLNALYLLYMAGVDSSNGYVLRGGYDASARWIKSLSLVSSTSCGSASQACTLDIGGWRRARSVQFRETALTEFDVVRRASTIYHEAMHAYINKHEHWANLSLSSVPGREILWLIWFSADANPIFSDDLRTLAATDANIAEGQYGMNLSWEVQPNIFPRHVIDPVNESGVVSLPRRQPDNPRGAGCVWSTVPIYGNGMGGGTYYEYPPIGPCQHSIRAVSTTASGTVTITYR